VVSVSVFCVVEGATGVEGTASFDGAKCVGGDCVAVGIPTTYRPVTLLLKRRRDNYLLILSSKGSDNLQVCCYEAKSPNVVMTRKPIEEQLAQILVAIPRIEPEKNDLSNFNFEFLITYTST
jgi:hypothetical protein